MRSIDSLMEKFYNGSADVDECTFLAGIITDEEGGPFDEYCRMRWNRPDDDVPADVRKRIKAELMKQIVRKERVQRMKKWKMWGKRISWTSSVAVFLALVSLTCWHLTGEKEPEVFKVVAERGQKSSLTLPDGSRVWLNSASTISYTSDYNSKERMVRLQGEAYFEVAANPDLAFVVHTHDMTVEALGTKFNVRAYVEDPYIVTTLVSGKVRTSAGDVTEILLPEQETRYDKRTGLLTKTEVRDAAHMVPWMSNEILFAGNSLREIAGILERMYNVTVIFDDAEIAGYTYTGLVRNNSLPNVLELISSTSPVKYRMSADTIKFSKKD